MSQYKYAEIADTVYFWFAANLTTGAAGDGATPLYDVRLAGAAANAAPTASGTPALLSHADYTDGLYEIAIDTTGWSAGEYAVFCTLTISTVNPAGFCGSFKLSAAGASLNSTIGLLAHADYGLAKLVRSTTPANTLTVDAAHNVGIIRPSGTIVADAGNSTTAFKTNLTSSEDDYIKDAYVKFTSGANINQVKKISAYNGTSKVITTAAFTDTPAENDTFVIINE